MSAVRELDVRPILASGRDPLPEILQELRQLPPGGVVRIRAPFVPAPLVALLEKRGFTSELSWEGPVCVASFWRAEASPGDEPEDDLASLQAARLQGDVLDARELESPLPMALVLLTVETHLPLTVRLDREPALLWPRLAERGLAWTLTPDDGGVRVEIVRRGAT